MTASEQATASDGNSGGESLAKDIAPNPEAAPNTNPQKPSFFQRWKWPLRAVTAIALLAISGVAVYELTRQPDLAWQACKSMEQATNEARIRNCGAVIASAEQSPRAMATAYRKRARAYFNLGEIASAIEDYTNALSFLKDDASLYAERGVARLRNGLPAKAIEDFDAAIALDPTLSETLIGRGNAQLAIGDPSGAAVSFTQALAANPLDAEAYYRRALANGRLNRIADAEADYDRAIEISPKNSTYWNSRCWFRATEGLDLDLALGDCDTALKLKPQLAPALDSRAFVLLRLGRLEEALIAYDQVIAIDARFAWPFFGRGIVKSRLGDYAGAQADFRAAIALQPDIAAQFAKYGEAP